MERPHTPGRRPAPATVRQAEQRLAVPGAARRQPSYLPAEPDLSFDRRPATVRPQVRPTPALVAAPPWQPLARPPLLLALLALSVAVLIWHGQATAPSRMSLWQPGAGEAFQAGTMARPISGWAGPGASIAAGEVAGSSRPLSLAGDVGFNVRAALDASGGALRRVTIAPGATWSFNAAVGDPSYVSIRTVGGVPGGGWCDLASRYVQAVRGLLPDEAIQFRNHVESTGIGLLDVDDADAVAIWNIGGEPGNGGGRGDLMITNTLASPLHFEVVTFGDNDVVVRALVAGGA